MKKKKPGARSKKPVDPPREIPSDPRVELAELDAAPYAAKVVHILSDSGFAPIGLRRFDGFDWVVFAQNLSPAKAQRVIREWLTQHLAHYAARVYKERNIHWNQREQEEKQKLEAVLKPFVLFAAEHHCVRATESRDRRSCAKSRDGNLCAPCAARAIIKGRGW